MKHLILAAAVLMIGTVSADAQSRSKSAAVSGSASQAGAVSGSQSAAYGGAGGASSSSAQVGSSSAGVVYAPTYNTPSRTRGTVNYEGDYTVRNVPQVTAPSMGSGHPCGLGGSVGFSIVGGGATGGATRVDKACMLAQMGLTDAAVYMYAASDPEVCAALVATGRASSTSYCGGAVAAPAAAQPTKAKATASTKGFKLTTRNCKLTGDNRIKVRYPSGVDKVAFNSACASAHGLQ